MSKKQIDEYQARFDGRIIEVAREKRAARRSKYECYFAGQIKLYKLPAPEVEYRFFDERRWRFDFAWPELMIAAEVEGVTRYGKNADGSMKLGRHQTAKGYEDDCDKYNQAVMLDWSVLRFPQKIIKSGVAIEQLRALIESRT